MAEQVTESDNQIEIENCNPCLLLEKKNGATTFCMECEENLCESCTITHASRKATKTHKPIPIQEKKNLLTKTCSPCGEKSTVAVKRCEECEEYLCSTCVENHLKRKATRNHVPIEISLHHQRLSDSDESDRLCYMCSINDLKVKADQYCIECTELLCVGCTNIHKNSKATRSHKLVPEYAKPEAVSKNENQSCEPCDLSGTEKVAVKYCGECREFLCDACGKRHGLQKSTMGHELKNACDIEVQKQCCVICIKVNETNLAVLFCQECEEELCEKCVLSHKNQRATRNHELLPLSENLFSEERDLNVCDPCQKRGLSAPAKHHCEDCDLRFCDACKDKHGRQKLTRNHVVLPLSKKPFFEEIEQNLDMCDPCQKKHVSKAAEHYCENCELYFCDACKDKHGRQKLTRNHVIKDAAAVRMSTARFCDPCISADDEVFAINHCLDCSEDLCEDCTAMHKMQKQSKDHKVVDVIEAPKRETEYCKQCKDNDKMSAAVKYCVVCKDYLCRDCCRFHSRMKHELKDIEEYKRENKCTCDPCMFSDKEVEAESFCKECAEFLCTACIHRHRAAKLSRNHTFLTAEEGQIHTLENAFFCDPCKYLDKSKKAFAYCKECGELLCDLCIKQHLAQKRTRTHEILTDLSKYKPEAAEEEPDNRNGKVDEIKQQKEMEKERDEKKQESTDIPGKPTSSCFNADSITLVWEKPDKFDDKRDYYQVSYRETEKEKWKFFPGEHEVANVTVTGLNADTKYIFRTRVVHPNGEGQYSEASEIIKTIVSTAAKLVNFSTIVKRGSPSPSVYGVPTVEIANARNTKNKTRKFEVGDQRRMKINKEKTIMLVGATGTGKSTLVDGIVNYALGVNWSDQFRFTIIDLEAEERDKRENQALSQTEWITVYTVHPEPGGRLDYRLNIIDTPGFGDTRGLQRDQEIVEQIRALFSESGAKGVACIDSICFLIKAPDARLTAVQSYIFQSIMALYGKDVEQNICSLITFADGIDPPVLAALRQSGLPFGKHFTFNNSGLFATNVNIEAAGLSPMFWEMGLKSFSAFFGHLEHMETKSLTLTKDVLEERKKLETTVQNLQPQVDAGLSKLNMLNEEIRIISQHKLDADANKDFEYEVEEIEQHKHELSPGKHTTNCIYCNYTCHKNCVYPDDEQKKKCSVMGSNGNCTQCPEKCSWKKHSNTPFIFEYVTVKKKKTYKEKLQKYQAAEGKRLTHEQVVQRMEGELTDLRDGIEHLMTTVKQCNERLSDIALRPNPLSMVDHIELMIKAEQMEKKQGYMQRIEMLEGMKQRALITTKAADLQQQLGKHSKTYSAKVETKDEKSESNMLKKFLSYLGIKK